MNNVTEHFVALNKKQAQSAVQAFQIGFDAWEMLVKLNLEATKSLLQEGATSVQTLAEVRDAAALSAWTATQFRAGIDKLSGYSRNVYEIVGQAGGNVGTLLEQTLLTVSDEFAGYMDEALKSAPVPQSEATAAATKVAMANAKTVIEGISQAVRQTAGYADANVRAAAAATAQAVKGGAR